MREPAKAAASTRAPAIDPVDSGTPPATAGRVAPAVRTPEDKLRFDLLRSAFYHEDCEIWFARLGRLITGASLALGTTAVAAVSKDYPTVAAGSGAAITVLSIIALVWDYGGRARDHRSLRQRYYLLLADLDKGEAVESIRPLITAVYAEEPPANEAVNCVAHNRAGRLLWNKQFERADISWMRRRLRHIVG